MLSNRTTLQGLYGTLGTDFADNIARLIIEETLREFGQNLTDSSFNLLDDALTGAQGVQPNVTDETTLKAVVTVGVAVGAHIIYRDTDAGNVLRVYELVAGTDAESSPGIVRPTDFDDPDNAKVWMLAASGSSLERVTTSTAGATITLDFNNLSERMFKGSAAIAAPKTWAFDNEGNAKALRSFVFTMTGMDPQTMPANVQMSDAGFVAGVWTPDREGKYDASAVYDEIDDIWLLTIKGPYHYSVS